MSEYDQPKTRKEKKGRDKQSTTPYSAKHVRMQEELAAQRTQKQVKERVKDAKPSKK